ncbi:MAG: NUDIX hydrolase [Rhizobacter sp.]|nr:NUDIX hydrolase [Chlorobiales bacterium]
MPYTYAYPRPALTVDCILFGYDEGDLKLLLVERGSEPFKGRWALPGGFVQRNETLGDAALRELAEETGVGKVYLEQLYTFGDLDRDPRGHTVSVAYFALVRPDGFTLQASTDAAAAKWFLLRKTPPLAFDHKKIVETAVERLKGKVRYQPIGFELLPKKFTLSQLQQLYEAVLETEIDKRNFRKKILSMSILKPLGEYEAGAANRPAQLYQFDRKKYDAATKSGFLFEL